MRGRQFGFLGVLSVAWLTTRVVVLSLQAPPPAGTAFGRPVQPSASVTPAASPQAIEPVVPDPSCCEGISAQAAGARPGPARGMNEARRSLITLPTTMMAPFAATDTPAAPIVALPAPTAWPQSPRPTDALQLYAYSYLRAGGAGLTGGRQYGGGQSGIVATYRLGSGNAHLMLRGAIAHADPSERELAAGLRVYADPRRSVSITLERRFRNGASDAFSAYIAGGKSDIAMPLAFRLDAYAQAGVVAGNDSMAFFDLSMRARRNLPIAKGAKVGAGIWAGGQDDAARLDIGPTIGTEFELGAQPFRIDADWRFRVAGEARPASGPALTLSTAF